MQQRRGTAAQWTAADPILAAGEIGFESDTGQFKIGDGINHWEDLSYFKNLEDLGGSLDDYVPVDTKGQVNGVASLDAQGRVPLSQLGNLIDGAPGALDTLNELAAAIEDDATFASTMLVALSQKASLTQLSDHTAATINVHGIADTALLATKVYTDGKASDAETAAITAAGTAADTKISTHNSQTTNVHGIANTSLLATMSYVDTAETDAVTAAGTAADSKIATAVAALTKSSVGLGNVDNTSDANKPVSTAQAAAIATAKSEAIADATSQVNAVIASAPAALNTLDELAAALGDDANFATTVTNGLAAKAPINTPTFTGLVTVAASGVAFTDGTQSKEGVPSRTPIIQKSASYTLSSLTERDSLIEVASSSATTITIPANSAVAYPVGTSIDILQTSTGQVTIAASAGVTVNATPGLKLRTQWSSATLFKRAENTWVVYGDLMA